MEQALAPPAARPTPFHKWSCYQQDWWCLLCKAHSNWGCHEVGKQHTKRIAAPWEYVTRAEVDAMMEDEQRDLLNEQRAKNEWYDRFGAGYSQLGFGHGGPAGPGSGRGSGSSEPPPPPPPRHPPPPLRPGTNVYHPPGLMTGVSINLQGPTQVLLALPPSDTQDAVSQDMVVDVSPHALSQDAVSRADQNTVPRGAPATAPRPRGAPATGSTPWVPQDPAPWY